MNLQLPTSLNMTPSQLSSYLYRLVQDLNMALQQTETQMQTVTQTAVTAAAQSVKKSPAETFGSIKALIIKSADIVNAYYEEINKQLSGEYVAQSVFGTFSQQTTNDIQANSEKIEQRYTDIQNILNGLESSIIGVNAYIRSGKVDEIDGVPIYGLEIGQKTTVDGQETFNKYARFSSNKLSFYDSNDNEVAYFSDYRLYVTNVEVTGTYRIGRLVSTARADGSVVRTYVGG